MTSNYSPERLLVAVVWLQRVFKVQLPLQLPCQLLIGQHLALPAALLRQSLSTWNAGICATILRRLKCHIGMLLHHSYDSMLGLYEGLVYI